jgi:hypothetical protein
MLSHALDSSAAESAAGAAAAAAAALPAPGRGPNPVSAWYGGSWATIQLKPLRGAAQQQAGGDAAGEQEPPAQ